MREEKKIENIYSQLIILRCVIKENSSYETQITQNIVKTENLKTNSAFICTKCRHTCHHPCPEKDMNGGVCIMSIPTDENNCKKCPNNCNLVHHRRVKYRYIIVPTTHTIINQYMRERFERAKKQEQSERMQIETKQRELNAGIQRIKTILAEWD